MARISGNENKTTLADLRAQNTALEKQLAEMRASMASAADIHALNRRIDDLLYKMGARTAAFLLGKSDSVDDEI